MNIETICGEWVGRCIEDRFTLIERLSSSQQSAYFLTEWVSLTEKDRPPRKAIIKLVAAGEDAEARMAVWQAAASFSHPNLMEVFACGRTEIDAEPLLYLVTEKPEEVLAEILAERPLTAQETGEMLAPLLDALGFLHGKGLVHSGVRPANIVAIGDRLKLSVGDWVTAGTVRKPSAEPAIFDAPETASGPITPAADIWALGVTLAQTLTQKLPLSGGAPGSDPQAQQPLPEPFGGIVRECLRSDPARRATIAALQARLKPAPSAQPAAEKEQTAKVNLGVIIAIAVVVLVVIIIWLVGSHRDSSANPGSDERNTPAAAETSAAGKPSAGKPLAGTTNTRDAAPPAGTNTAAAANTNSSAPANTNIPVLKTTNSGVVKQVQPDVLPDALASISGEVTVSIRVTVDSAGEVTAADFVSTGHSKYFASKAMEAAQQWKFQPAAAETGNSSRFWFLNFQFAPGGIEIGAAQAQ
jgi:TonB family protein